jgi:5,10-methenyltetrahydromethanopterin hydrogenase
MDPRLAPDIPTCGISGVREIHLPMLCMFAPVLVHCLAERAQVVLDDFQPDYVVHQHLAMGMDRVSEAQIAIVNIEREYPPPRGSEHLALPLSMRRTARSDDASFTRRRWDNRFAIIILEADASECQCRVWRTFHN